MLEQWVELGLDPLQFWDLTPRVMGTIAAGARRREVAAHNGRVWLAWNTVALARPKRLPPLRSLLIDTDRGPARARTWQQQLAIAKQMIGKPAHGR